MSLSVNPELYILSFLHQTTTIHTVGSIYTVLYILSFLHQTTTPKLRRRLPTRCISYLFYIKPQLHRRRQRLCWLYILSFLHQTTTYQSKFAESKVLYILSFLHQTTTASRDGPCGSWLYILSFLHQTTTYTLISCNTKCCISYLFYIKPQPGTMN